MKQSRSVDGERQAKEVKETGGGEKDLSQVTMAVQNEMHGIEIILMIKQMITFFWIKVRP